MLVNMTANDLDLLRQFARDRAQDAFSELVKRHLNLVYSAALRQVRSPQLAEEIAQSVFADLARDANKLKAETILTAWLYAVTRRTAIDVIRKESRRQLREQIAVEMNAMNTAEANWTDIEPLLDEAVAALDEADRSAILLRYFGNKSLCEVGDALGISDDTAQKRVSRAVERLRDFFSKRKITVGTGGLTILISANAVQSAPVGLAVAISATAVLTGTAVQTSTVIAATKTIAMTTIQKTLITATLAVVAGAGIYEARQAAQLRDQVQTLQQQQEPLAEQIQQLQSERDDATNRLAALLAENSRLKNSPNQNELLKLRGEATRLRLDSQELARLKAGQTKSQNDGQDPLLSRMNQLKKLINDKPELGIPEMQLLTPQDWLNVVAAADLGTENGVRQALSRLRSAAKLAFAPLLQEALNKYVQASGGQLPSDITQLKPFFASPVDDSLLERYQLLRTGKASEIPAQAPAIIAASGTGAGDSSISFRPPSSEGSVVAEKSKIDGDFDSVLSIGMNGSYLQEGGPVGSGLDFITRSTILGRNANK